MISIRTICHSCFCLLAAETDLPVWRTRENQEVRHAEQPDEPNGGPSAEAPGSALPPNQNGAMPDGPIPEVDEERGRSGIGVNTRHRLESICSSTASSGSRSRRSCGRRYERKREEVRTGSRSGTCLRTSGAPERSWNFCSSRRWGVGWDRAQCHRSRVRTKKQRRNKEQAGMRRCRRRERIEGLSSCRSLL